MIKPIYICYVLAIGMSLAALLGTILDFGSGGANKQDRGPLHQIAGALNKSLPRQVSGKVRFERVDVEDPDLFLNFLYLGDFSELAHVAVNAEAIGVLVTRDVVRQEFVDIWCSDKQIVQFILSRGGGIKYRYLSSTRENSIVYSFTIHDCPGVGLPAVNYSDPQFYILTNAHGEAELTLSTSKFEV